MFALEAPEDSGSQGNERVTQSSKGLEVESEAVRDDEADRITGGKREGGRRVDGDLKGESA